MEQSQSFADSKRNTLRRTSTILRAMKDRPLLDVIAANVKAARVARGIPSYQQLATKAHVSPNTVKNIEEPGARLTGKRGEASPRMDILEKIANALGYPAWHLMLQNFDPNDPPPRNPPTAREISLHRKIERAYRELDKTHFDGNDSDE